MAVSDSDMKWMRRVIMMMCLTVAACAGRRKDAPFELERQDSDFLHAPQSESAGTPDLPSVYYYGDAARWFTIPVMLALQETMTAEGFDQSLIDCLWIDKLHSIDVYLREKPGATFGPIRTYAYHPASRRWQLVRVDEMGWLE